MINDYAVAGVVGVGVGVLFCFVHSINHGQILIPLSDVRPKEEEMPSCRDRKYSFD